MNKPRARNLGIPFDGQPGPLNAITDVAGVAVGHTTLISGEGKLEVGKGPVRTGVTAVRLRGASAEPVFGAWHTLNGCGEMTGTIWLEESGLLYGPIMITNTYAVGAVRDAIAPIYGLPVVAETYDGVLNDIKGFHVKQEHALAALAAASAGAVAEGNVGGGTGMFCHGFKGGIGTASRQLGEEDVARTVLSHAPHSSDAERHPLGQSPQLMRQQRAVRGHDDDDRAGRGVRFGPLDLRLEIRDFAGDRNAGDGEVLARAMVGLHQNPHGVAAVFLDQVA